MQSLTVGQGTSVAATRPAAETGWRDRLGQGVLAAQPWLLYAFCFSLTFSNALIEILSAALIACWIMQRIGPLEHRPPSRWLPAAAATWPLAAYLAACLLSIATSTYPWLSMQGFLQKTLQYGLITLVTADLAMRPGVAGRATGALVASAALLAVDVIVQRVWGRDLLLGIARFPDGGRLTGPFRNPIDLATCLAVLLPLVVVFIGAAAGWRRAGLLLLFTVLLGELIAITARSGWLSLLVATAVLVLAGRTLRRWLLPAVITAFVIGLAMFAVTGRLHGAITLTDAGSRDRVYMWQSAWWMIRERPILGQGLNTFMANYLSHWVGGERLPRYAHNCYLQIAAETGLIGLAAFGWFLLSLLGSAWRRLRSLTTTAENRMLLLGWLGALAAFLVQACFDTNFYSVRFAALFWCLAGLILGAAATARPR